MNVESYIYIMVNSNMKVIYCILFWFLLFSIIWCKILYNKVYCDICNKNFDFGVKGNWFWYGDELF